MISVVERFRKGLEKSRRRLADVVDLAMGRGVFDDAAADQIEEALIVADVGPETAGELMDELKEWVRVAGGGVTAGTVREALAAKIAEAIADIPSGSPKETVKPEVVILVGVNGSGKTTTTAKLAEQAASVGGRVVLGAADTFRAAAIDQLKIWGDRIGAEVVAQPPGADSAAVAYDAVKAAQSRGADICLIDTAGRLHNKTHLMAELEKLVRVVGKLKPPDQILLILDATTGQNGILQVESFARSLPVTGIVITKLDGTARAGMVIQAVKKFRLPVKYIGVGESAADLLPFSPESFAAAIVGD